MKKVAAMGPPLYRYLFSAACFILSVTEIRSFRFFIFGVDDRLLLYVCNLIGFRSSHGSLSSSGPLTR